MSDALLMREFGDWLVFEIQYVVSEVVSGLTHPAFLGFMCIGVFPSLLMYWLFCEGEEKLGIESVLFCVVCFFLSVLFIICGFLFLCWRCNYGT